MWRLYSNASMSIIRISDMQVFLNVLIWVMLMVILLIILSVAGDLQPTYISLDAYRPYHDYITCVPTRQTAFTVVLAIILAYCGLIILVGLFVAYKVRSIPYSVYDESKTIAFSMYNVSFFVILLAALRLSNAASREVLFVLQSMAIVIAVVITLSTILYSKFSYIKRGDTTSTMRGSTTRSGSTTRPKLSSPSIGSSEDDKSVRLSAYKERVSQLETLLKKNSISFPAWTYKAGGSEMSVSASKSELVQ